MSGKTWSYFVRTVVYQFCFATNRWAIGLFTWQWTAMQVLNRFQLERNRLLLSNNLLLPSEVFVNQHSCLHNLARIHLHVNTADVTTYRCMRYTFAITCHAWGVALNNIHDRLHNVDRFESTNNLTRIEKNELKLCKEKQMVWHTLTYRYTLTERGSESGNRPQGFR